MTLPPRFASLPGPTALAAPEQAFTDRVRQQFGRRASSYESQARLQQGVAWRLARLVRELPLPQGPIADLGAGSGLLSRALLAQRPELAAQPPHQVDLCPELLARNPLAGSLPPWDLNGQLPDQLDRAALLVSSFALQWLATPSARLRDWCGHLAPGGWLALAVPVAGSFGAWQEAAAAAGVPCTALPLPRAEELVAGAADQLDLHRSQRLRFSRPNCGGLATLRLLSQLGATASPHPPLSPGQLRRLLAHWPERAPLRWDVLVLLGCRR